MGGVEIKKVYKGSTKIFGEESIELPIYAVTQWKFVQDYRTYYNKCWKVGPIVNGYSPVFYNQATGKFPSLSYHTLVDINGTLGEANSTIAVDSKYYQIGNYTDTITDGLGYKWHRYLFINSNYPDFTNRFYHVSPGQKVGDKVPDWGQMTISNSTVKIESRKETSQTVNLNAAEGSIIYRY